MDFHLFLTALALGAPLFAYSYARSIPETVATDFEAHTFHGKQGSLPYRILKPYGYKPGEKYPLIVFLHGLSERGSDNKAQLRHGGSFFSQPDLRRKYPAWVVLPQCPADEYWIMAAPQYPKPGQLPDLGFLPNPPLQRSLSLVAELTAHLKNADGVDANRVYLGGLSLGAMGVLDLIPHKPDLFSAAFAIAGGAHPALAEKYPKDFPIWLFHGSKDNVVNPEYSRRFVEALKKGGASARFTEFPNGNHYNWAGMLPEEDLFEFLLEH